MQLFDPAQQSAQDRGGGEIEVLNEILPVEDGGSSLLINFFHVVCQHFR